jgi:hypothetical protein
MSLDPKPIQFAVTVPAATKTQGGASVMATGLEISGTVLDAEIVISTSYAFHDYPVTVKGRFASPCGRPPFNPLAWAAALLDSLFDRPPIFPPMDPIR